VPLEEVDVNVHPAKTEVRFRRAAAVSDAVRESVRGALASAGFVRSDDFRVTVAARSPDQNASELRYIEVGPDENEQESDAEHRIPSPEPSSFPGVEPQFLPKASEQERIEFGYVPPPDDIWRSDQQSSGGTSAIERHALVSERESAMDRSIDSPFRPFTEPDSSHGASHFEAFQGSPHSPLAAEVVPQLPPLVSASELMREVAVEDVGSNIRPLGQLEESFIIATDDEGLLLIDQHVAHERILFDKFRKLESSRQGESQNLLIPETFDLTPAQAAAFDSVAEELENYGFGLMRLSGRTVAIKAVPADLPAGEARNMLSEVLDTIDSEKRGVSRETLRDEIAASLACKAAIKINMPLVVEKMRWLIDRLLLTSSPTTCPHGRPVILRLTVRDIEKGFHRPQKGKK
jgi:DNA mismatch repair protein MutL